MKLSKVKVSRIKLYIILETLEFQVYHSNTLRKALGYKIAVCNRNCNAVNEKYSSFNGIADQHAIACLSKSSCHAISRRVYCAAISSVGSPKSTCFFLTYMIARNISLSLWLICISLEVSIFPFETDN